MNDKKQQIIEAAMRCFARKGFHATSIQEIVDELGMAKGSIYFYFKSKEDLLLAVIWYYAERMMQGMTVLSEERLLTPREQFRLQLNRHFGYFRDNRDFLLMLVQEPPVEGFQKSTFRVMLEMRSRMMQWKKQHILAIYGSEAALYAWDGAGLLSGMMNEFMHMHLLKMPSFDTDRLSDYLLERLDDLMLRLIERQGPPLIQPELAERGMKIASEADSPEREIRQVLGELQRKIEEADDQEAGAERRSDMRGATARLQDELDNPIPDRIIVRGMLAYMKDLALPAWKEQVEWLVNRMNVH